MLEQLQAKFKALDEVQPDTRRGGELRTLLSPRTVGSTTGFMGVATIAPGDKISEHYHPYSEEFVYLVRGELVVRLDGTPYPLRAGQGVMIPINVRHRFMNEGTEESFMIFHLCPLAPRPELGHVDTE
jgi:putative monooxygenase